ncbi:hypothetical protein [Actinomyces graevenitzii]|nr:hypothetical protein [Actinomyces graevenitzii]
MLGSLCGSCVVQLAALSGGFCVVQLEALLGRCWAGEGTTASSAPRAKLA